jgi:hypothetical protein
MAGRTEYCTVYYVLVGFLSVERTPTCVNGLKISYIYPILNIYLYYFAFHSHSVLHCMGLFPPPATDSTY